eukprot:298818_1
MEKDFNTYNRDQLLELVKELKEKELRHEQLRRSSIQTVHSNMLSKLLDAQVEHDEKECRLYEEIHELNEKIKYLENDMENQTIQMLLGNSLDQIIPKHLNKGMKLKYRLLFDGYSRMHNKNVPNAVNELISYFYPIFSVDYVPSYFKINQ